MEPSIVIRNARVHNLKNITVSIPHNQLTVVTGVSGSGKSSLVFDTVYAEGQRRYVESLSAYARQFLERMEKPDVDEIVGIAPPIAIKQKNQTRNPRSTVGTSTELYDFLRVLFARAGRTYCPTCGQRVQRDNVDFVAEAMLAQPEGSRWYVLFPVQAHAAQGADAVRDKLFELRGKGFNRLFQAGRTFEFSTPESLLEIDFTQPLFALVDRITLAPDLKQRLVDSAEICYREAGEVWFENAQNAGEQLRFSERFACKRCGLSFKDPEPSLFSFNNPFGACPRCQGFGNVVDYSPARAIPDPTNTLEGGAVDPWNKPNYDWGWTDFLKRAKDRVRLNVPYADLTEAERRIVEDSLRRFFAEVEKKKYKVHVRVFLSRYRGYTNCPDCQGDRLRPEALYVRLGDCTISAVTRMNITRAREFFEGLALSPEESVVADKVLAEVRQRLHFLENVGLEYLTLDRLSATLSGGEAQRITLATCLGSRLVGACYVLDEPSIGLHSRDTNRLIRIMHDLRDLGNTVLVVEHDADVMRAADHIIDLGPGAGELGGQVLFQGSYAELLADGTRSLTSRYLRNEQSAARQGDAKPIDKKDVLRFEGARVHNLKNVDVTIPLHRTVVVTGVSGSGKSTLVHDVIFRTLERRLQSHQPERTDEAADAQTADQQTCKRVVGAERIKQVLLVDQSPIGRTPRSNPATYTKSFDLIRDLFASTPEAERHGYGAGQFSFNIPGGRCETCQGDGTVTVEMQFLADVELVCEECKGTRYKSAILAVRYNGLSIDDVLKLTVHEALAFFSGVPRLVQRLKVLDDVGLGYLRLGQSATTLSGGEAQRVKLAAHLGQATSEGTLFIFDEPTTGLHFEDIHKLLRAFDKLVDNGGSLLVIEHNLDVVRSADWIIDLGPEGGDGGGEIVAIGTPHQIACEPRSHTGRFLASNGC